jgi:hypothetical protein
VAEMQRSFWRRNRWLMWLAGAVVVVLAALGVTAAIALRRAEPFLRAEIVAALSRHFHARVELDSFHVSLVKGIEAEGKGLRIWPPAKHSADQDQSAEAPANDSAVEIPAGEGDPLIQLDEFHFHAALHYKPGQAVRIRTVELKGLTIHVPPKVKPENAAHGHKDSSGAGAGATEDASGPAAQGAASPAGQQKSTGKWLSFVVDSIECTGTELVLETNKPGKLPLTFEIAQLELTGVSASGPMKFDADLTNPRPLGQIHSTGSFGPWVKDDPGESAVSGDYTFSHADLATFKGIAGILESTGHYEGTLRNLTVDGVTDTPDFRLTMFGTALPLHTKFHARVDGTNGDTWLEPVEATLGHSHFTAEGPIVRVAATGADGKLRETGRDIALKVNVDKARIEDFLALASPPERTAAVLTGDVTVKALLHIPPGKEPVPKRMGLDGEFRLNQVQFSSADIQGKIRQLSLRGQGHPGDVKKTSADAIESEMNGKFKLEGGVITLPQLEYSVPGAEIDLAGSYALEGGALKFGGTAKMQATVSAMVGGWKGLLLKPADRFFKKDGAGTEVPIQIGGTREKPEFQVDVGKMKFSPPQKAKAKPDDPQQATPEAKPEH